VPGYRFPLFPQLLENANVGVLTTVGPDTVAHWALGAWVRSEPSFILRERGVAADCWETPPCLLHSHSSLGRDDLLGGS